MGSQRPRAIQTAARDARQMSLLFALDFWKVPPTPTSKIPVRPRLCCFILACDAAGRYIPSLDADALNARGMSMPHGCQCDHANSVRWPDTFGDCACH